MTRLSRLLFRWLFRSRRLARRVGQQVLKRSPVNVRPLLGIPKGRNPVTLALGLQAGRSSRRSTAEIAPLVRRRGQRLVRELEALRRRGGAAPAGATTSTGRRGTRRSRRSRRRRRDGLRDERALRRARALWRSTARSSCARARARFVQRDLYRTPGPDGSFCWSYSPDDRSRVLNATAKGARLLAQVGVSSRAGRTSSRRPGVARLRGALATRRRIVAVCRRRPTDVGGQLPHGLRPRRPDGVPGAHGRRGFDDAVDRGWRYYRSRFFDDGWRPRYYDTSALPVDCTAVAQSMITLCRFGDVSTALRIGAWSVETSSATTAASSTA